MGREVRMVPAGWQHPMEWLRRQHVFTPLHEGPFSKRVAEWDEAAAKWEQGLRKDWGTGEWKSKDPDQTCGFSEWHGERPKAEDYMPEFPEGTATHYMMYETCSEGTPISPAFATPEELAHWLADNNASASGGMGAPYEDWLRVCNGGYAPSAVMDAKGFRSGVEL